MASTQLIEVVGLMKEHNFQFAKGIAEVNVYVSDTPLLFLESQENNWISHDLLLIQGLKQKFPSSFADLTVHPLLECDWHRYLDNKKMVRRLSSFVSLSSFNLFHFMGFIVCLC